MTFGAGASKMYSVLLIGTSKTAWQKSSSFFERDYYSNSIFLSSSLYACLNAISTNFFFLAFLSFLFFTVLTVNLQLKCRDSNIMMVKWVMMYARTIVTNIQPRTYLISESSMSSIGIQLVNPSKKQNRNRRVTSLNISIYVCLFFS